MKQPVFIAVFKPTRTIVRDVTPIGKLVREMDRVVHIAYDSTGQRWGFVERITAGSGQWDKEFRPDKLVARGWVKLPTKILDETWEESP